jgi:hypothetical protein
MREVMMTDLRTAAQQALEALEEATNYTGCETWSPSMTDECLAVAAALRAALAEHDKADAINRLEDDFKHNIRQTQDRIRAALTEDALQRLTDVHQEIEAALEQPKPRNQCGETCERAKLCAICARGLEQPEQEPVACSNTFACRCPKHFTHPPRREWRGLKEWEINDGLDQLPTEDVCSWSFRKGVYFAEAALKERNA